MTGEEMRLDAMCDDPGRALQETIGVTVSCGRAQRLAGTVEAVAGGAHRQIRGRTGEVGPVCARFRDRIRIMAGAPKGPGTYHLSPADFSDLAAGTSIHLFGSYLEGEQCSQVEAAVPGAGGSPAGPPPALG